MFFFICRNHTNLPVVTIIIDLIIKLGTKGGGDRLWVLGTLIYEQVKLQRGGRWLEPGLNIHTSLSPAFTLIFF